MRLIDRLALPLAVLLLLTGASMGQNDDLGEKLNEMNQAYQAEMTELGATYRASTDDAEKQAIINEQLPALRNKYTDMFMTFATEHAGASVAASALTTAYTLTNDSEAQAKIQAQLKEDYLDSDGMVEAIAIFQNDSEFLSHLIDNSKNRNVVGVATFMHMNSIKGRSLTESNEEKVLPLMEKIIAEFGDVQLVYPGGREMGTLSSMIDNELFAYRNLRIGKVAPEIEGEDIDGVEFKLTDYRGKVVVIDFWGDW